MANTVTIERRRITAVCKKPKKTVLQTMIADDYNMTVIDLTPEQLKLSPHDYLKFILQLCGDEELAEEYCFCSMAQDILEDFKMGYKQGAEVDGEYIELNEGR